MTEDEAKTKWCPAFRGNDHGVNRPLDLETDALMGRCIGSDCMAWRWVRMPKAAVAAHEEAVHVGGGNWTKAYVEASEGRPGDGFCGLAGKLA